MSNAKIGILVKDGKIVMKVQIEKLSQSELSMLINNLDILKTDLLLKFKQGTKRVEDG